MRNKKLSASCFSTLSFGQRWGLSLGLALMFASACGSTSKDDKDGQGKQEKAGPMQKEGTGPNTNGATGTSPNTGAGADGGDNGTIAPGSVELGEPCEQDQDCKSNICVEADIFPDDSSSSLEEFKTCGSCRDDAQCRRENKGLACKMSIETGIVECLDGKLGSPCREKEHCADNLMCALINMGENKHNEKTCSECEKHVDCPAMGKRNCVARDTEGYIGYYNKCMEDKVRQTGEICFPCETGDRECAGGFCKKVDFEIGDDFCMGVCGGCNTDVDCPAEHYCSKPELNFEVEGLAPHTPSKCVKK